MVKRTIIGIFALCYVSLYASGQDNDSLHTATPPPVKIANTTKSDTVAWVDPSFSLDKTTEKAIEIKTFKPDPNKAVLYSAIFPGLGQIYNRKYWKLPLIYGGFVGLYYAISWNGRYYNDYTKAYKAIMSDAPRSDSNFAIWGAFISGNVKVSDITDSQLNSYKTRFRNKRDSYRRYRDLSIIGAVALYGLCMIDAYVDAHLFDFDISPDLSMRVEPKMEQDPFARKTFGLQCSFTF